jgi:PAS domain S-box-containing protein
MLTQMSSPLRRGKWRYLLTVTLIAATYLVTGKLGLTLAVVAKQVTTVWPPTGIALAALLLFGYRVWPGVALGAFLANFLTDESLLTACGIATGNTLEAVLGAYLLRRVGFQNSLERLHDVLTLVGFAALLSTTVSATIGATSLGLGHVVPWSAFGSVWLVWWMGDAMGDLIVAPLLLTWATKPHFDRQEGWSGEARVLFLGLVTVCVIVFASGSSLATVHYEQKYVVFPFMIWSALRLGQRTTATAVFITSAIALWGATHHLGPFAVGTLHARLLLLQAFMGTLAITGLAMGAVTAERKRVEGALRGSEERFRLLVDCVQDYAVFMLDRLGRVVGWNAGAARIMGYRSEEIIGRHFVRFFSPKDTEKDKPEHKLREARTHGRFEEEGWQLRKNGSKFWASIVITALQDEGGLLLGFAVVIRNLTEFKRAEEKFRIAVEAAPNAMIIINESGRVALVNPQVEKLFGYTNEELIDQPIEILVPERYRNQHSEYRASFLATPQTRPMGAGRDLYGLTKDGREIPVEIALSPIETREGTMVLASISDITERKRTEEQTKASLREKEVLLKEIHHRVKNNLQVISSLLNLQASSIKDAHHLELFKESQNRVRSMALIHERLYQSKDLATIDFGDYTRSLTTHLFQSYGLSQDIVLNIEVDSLYLDIDTAIPCGLMVNELVSNALKHAFLAEGTKTNEREASGEIRVALHRSGDVLRLRVSDNGVGLPEEVTIGETKTLGLTLVQALTSQLEGTLEIERQPGTIFTITFPNHRFPERR